MVLSKMKAGSLPPHVAGEEHTLAVGGSKQVIPSTSGKATKNMVANEGATESRSDRQMSNVSARGSSGADAPSVGPSIATEGSQRSAVRITRSSGIKKPSPKVKKSKTPQKKKGPEDPLVSKKLPHGRALPPRPSKSNGNKRAAKKAAPRPKPKQTTKKDKGHIGEIRDAPEKTESKGNAVGVSTEVQVTPRKPGGVLKGCKSDDDDRNDAMESGVKAVEATSNGKGGAIAGSQLWSVASGDMAQVQTYLSKSYRSFEGGALKMKHNLVNDSKTGLQDIGRSASEWKETKKVECTENIIPMLFADGKMFITQAIGAMAAGCGALSNSLVVSPDADAKGIDHTEEKLTAEVEDSNDTSEGGEEKEEEEEEKVQEVACQQHTQPSRLDQPPAKLAHLFYS
jgi:hypothetical protein